MLLMIPETRELQNDELDLHKLQTDISVKIVLVEAKKASFWREEERPWERGWRCTSLPISPSGVLHTLILILSYLFNLY